MGLPKEIWERLKALKPVRWAAKTITTGFHPDSVLYDKVKFQRAKIPRGGKPKNKNKLTNHQRVMVNRAARKGITRIEYEKQYCQKGE